MLLFFKPHHKIGSQVDAVGDYYLELVQISEKAEIPFTLMISKIDWGS